MTVASMPSFDLADALHASLAWVAVTPGAVVVILFALVCCQVALALWLFQRSVPRPPQIPDIPRVDDERIYRAMRSIVNPEDPCL